ncbi:hypothetical protein GCM10010211_16280 [Streptomyces albospinus]|uniref:Uncharacterized protein n=1 Tax=Streptomyces albospinus TaxID=285515 RepID=A0ABQ2UVR5_9ACTN|nr:hypothetical protein GCM10010211_16280 [Streptomyces albospinus]
MGCGGGEIAPLGGADGSEQFQQLELGGGLRGGGAHSWSVPKVLHVINYLLDHFNYLGLPSAKYLMSLNIYDLKH